VNGINLTYDALGRMVEQQNGSAYTQILYSPAGKAALMSGQTLNKAFINLPGGGTAIYNSTGLAYYRHSDWLGSSRLTSTAGRGVYSITAYGPYGEQYAASGTSDPSFTGENSDTVPSLYDFLYRENSPSQGRWISPDPAGLGVVDPTNPQTWNRYAYALNNPLSNIDPTGLECVWDDGSYDSNDDPDTGLQADGTHPGCEGNGGHWVDHSYFAAYGMADWSPNANSNMTCAGVASSTPSTPAGFSFSQQAQSNASMGPVGWFFAFKNGGSQDYKGNPAFGDANNQRAVGNFNFGGSCAAKPYGFGTCTALAGGAAQIQGFLSGLAAGAAVAPNHSVGTAPTDPTTMSLLQQLESQDPTAGLPGLPVTASNGVPTQGDQAAPYENAAVAAGFLSQSLGCHQ